MSLVDHRVLVIGGSSGMGLATARAAAQAGAAVTITSTARDRLDVALAALPDGCTGEVLDLRDDDAIARLFDHLGELHHLVITAGGAVRPRPLAGAPANGLWGSDRAAPGVCPSPTKGLRWLTTRRPRIRVHFSAVRLVYVHEAYNPKQGPTCRVCHRDARPRST